MHRITHEIDSCVVTELQSLISLSGFHQGYVQYRTNDGFFFVIQCSVEISNKRRIPCTSAVDYSDLFWSFVWSFS
jgi:hypothetical protein